MWRAYRLPYVVSIFSGDIHRRMKTLHDFYGPVVRIAPNELSFTDASAWRDIYASHPGHLPFERNRTWFVLKADEPQTIMGPDEEVHSRMRRCFAHSFSEKSLKDQSPLIEKYVDGFIAALNSRCGQVVDMKKWLDYVSFDIAGDLSFGESFGNVENERAHLWVEIANGFGKGLVLISTINLYPPLGRLLHYILPKQVLQKQLEHRSMSAARVQQRLCLQTDRADFVTPAKKYSDAKDSLTEGEWEMNMSIVVFAGSETTSTALTAVIRYLAQNEAVMLRLKQEIRSQFSDENEITIGSTSSFPFLNAVINEGLRIAPPTAIGIPRVVPKGGSTVCGRWVPAHVRKRCEYTMFLSLLISAIDLRSSQSVPNWALCQKFRSS